MKLDTLLAKTSRTFALAIAFLPEGLREQITVAYLLFRIADTLEDADLWPLATRVQALSDLALAVERRDTGAIEKLSQQWGKTPPVEDPGYLELLADSRYVLESLEDLPVDRREAIRHHLLLTTRGMATFLSAAQQGSVRIGNIQDLRGYCRVVAGVVGDMLTELYLLHDPKLITVGAYLRERASRFGEGLQLVNILKDQLSDEHQRRHYLPDGVPVPDIIGLARRSLDAAEEYTAALARAGAPALLAYHALLVRLARASLARVEERGPGAKLTRTEVMAIVLAVQKALAEGLDAAAEPTVAREDAGRGE
jgi:farnesyl-diphosphate farnesyltransferase